jgi:hypothetical protein
VLTLGIGVKSTDFVFFASAVNQLADQRRHFTLSADDIALINPNTRTCPVFRSQMDAELTKKIYMQVPVLINESITNKADAWDVKMTTMFHMTNDSSLMHTTPAEDLEMVWEAKMTGFWDHRESDIEMNFLNTTRQAQTIPISESEHRNFTRIPKGQFWTRPVIVDERIPESWVFNWIFCFKRVTASTNWRTLVPCIVPRGPISYTLYCLFTDEESVRSGKASCLFAALGSLIVDYCLRHKTGQPSLPLWCPEQVPVHPPKMISCETINFVGPRVARLIVSAQNIKDFARNTGIEGIDPEWAPEKRAVLQAELDAYYAHLYGLSRDELRYILDPADLMGPDYPSETFRVLKNNEIRQFGEYRTQRLVLEAWDRLLG